MNYVKVNKNDLIELVEQTRKDKIKEIEKEYYEVSSEKEQLEEENKELRKQYGWVENYLDVLFINNYYDKKTILFKEKVPHWDYLPNEFIKVFEKIHFNQEYCTHSEFLIVKTVIVQSIDTECHGYQNQSLINKEYDYSYLLEKYREIKNNLHYSSMV